MIFQYLDENSQELILWRRLNFLYKNTDKNVDENNEEEVNF